MGIFRPRYDGAKPGMQSYHPTRWLAAALIERMCGASEWDPDNLFRLNQNGPPGRRRLSRPASVRRHRRRIG
ncbi:hypothetical protein GCM10009530_22230 [Microbispora corallina]|uniref:Uncharacterized protein n=2 Tax=Microbispora corallina TaxID=83302 RepID=A0ABQ4G6B7_9ACTN|nr:hypothetical protein Mco01_55650 [Microbispora corallina]